MNSNRLAASLGAAFVLTASVSTAALAQAPVCSAPVKVLAQPRDGLTLLEDSKDEFKKTVTEGRLEKGMVSFKESKTVMDNLDNLYAYLKGRSNGDIKRAKVEEIKP